MSGCACLIDNEGEASDVSFTRMQMASKTHCCGECGREIRPGETYERVSGKWDCGFETYKTCADCLSVRDTYFCSYSYGCVWEDLENTVHDSRGNVADARLCELTPAARTRVMELIEAEWEEVAMENPVEMARRAHRPRWRNRDWMRARTAEIRRLSEVL